MKRIHPTPSPTRRRRRPWALLVFGLACFVLAGILLLYAPRPVDTSHAVTYPTPGQVTLPPTPTPATPTLPATLTP